jgi:hypothetical protein
VDTVEILETLQRQSKNKMWKQERCKRLKASNFGRICKATERINFSNLADALTVPLEVVMI